MSRADRYLMRRVALPLIAVVLVVGVVVGLWQLGRISSLVLMGAGDVGLLLQLIADLAPGFAGLAMGTAGIFGALLSYDRLAEDGELTAMSACGTPPYRVFGPAIVCGSALGALVMGAGVWGEPWGASRYGQDVALLATGGFSRSLKVGTFNPLGNMASVYVGGAETNAQGVTTWKDVVVGRDVEAGAMVLSVHEAHVTPVGVGLVMVETGAGEAILPSPKPEEVTRVAFTSAKVTLDVMEWAQKETLRLYEFQSLPFDALWEESGKSESRHELPKLRHFMWQKLALPFGMPMLCVLGALTGGQRASLARARAYVTAALVVAAYFGVLGLGRNMVITGLVPAWFGANIPNLSVGALLVWWWKTRGARWA